MYWRSEKEIIEEFAGVLRRIFSYVGQLSNKDRELVNLPTGSVANLVFETFGSRSEAYPQIQIDSGGITFKDTLNNLISEVTGEEEYLGVRPLKSILVTDLYPLKIQLPSSLIGASVRGFLISFASNDFYGGDNINLYLYKNYQTTPSLQASGSLWGNDTTKYVTNFSELSQEVEITDEDWWLEVIPQLDNQYIFGIDESIDASYIYYENGIQVEATGSLHASILAPSFVRIGGMLEGSILIKCAAEEDSALARDLASTTAIYCNLLKQAQISRKSLATNSDKTKSVFGQDTQYDEWLEKGIRIKNIRINPMNYRRRSSNTIIYESTVIVDVMTEWFQDYAAATLNEVGVDIKSLLPPDFIGMNFIITNE